MGGIGLDGHGQGGGGAAQALWANAQGVHPLQHPGLHIRVIWVGAGLVQGPQQGPLGQLGRQVGGPAQTHAHHDRRAGIGARPVHRLHDEVLHVPLGGRGREHLQGCHILAAKALGGHGDGHLVPRGQARIEDGRGIVVGIAPPQGIGHHRKAQVPLHIAPGHAGVDRLLQGAAGQVAVLAPVHKNHRHSRVLADGQAPLGRKGKILLQVAQNRRPYRGALLSPGLPDGLAYVSGQLRISLDAKVAHRLCHRGAGYFSHIASSFFGSTISSLDEISNICYSIDAAHHRGVGIPIPARSFHSPAQYLGLFSAPTEKSHFFASVSSQNNSSRVRPSSRQMARHRRMVGL